MTARETIPCGSFWLYNHDHVGDDKVLIDDDGVVVAYVQWTTWKDYIEIDALESHVESGGRLLVSYLKERFGTIVLTSRKQSVSFWRKMGFVQYDDDPLSFIWRRH